MSEQWKPIPGYEGLYDVSDEGRVWSYKNNRVVGNYANASYSNIILHKDGQATTFNIHILVMLAFVGPCPPGQEIRHGDGDHRNNHLSNLCYGTPEENARDREEHGRTYRGVRHWKCKLTEGQVVEALQRIEDGELLKDVAKDIGVSKTHMIRIRNSKAWSTTANPIKSPDLRKGRSRGSRTLTPDQIEEAYQLLDSGMSQRKVGERFGVSQRPIGRLVKLREYKA